MKHVIRVLLLAGMLVVALAAPAPSHAARGMEVTVQDDAVFLYPETYYNRDRGLAQARDLGVSQLRINVLWWQTMPRSQAFARNKPSRIAYDWSMWDSAIARAKAFGMNVQLDLTGEPPRWACGNKRPPNKCKGFKPNLKHFQQFAQAAARHFGSRVTRYSIWNEPNWHTWLRPHKSAALVYRGVYQAGYKGIKKGRKRSKVLMGELAPYSQPGRAIAPLKFLRDMVCVDKRFRKTRSARRKCKGGALKLDGFAHHPYDFKVPPTKKRKGRDNITMANLGALTKTLDTMRKRRLLKPSVKKVPLYLTEHGYFVKGPRRVSEAKRSRWTVKAFDMAQRNKRVKGMLYYVLVSPPAGHPSDFFDLGLITTSGQERGAFFALRNWVRSAAASGRVKRPGRCNVSC